jgi:hypothetical protein
VKIGDLVRFTAESWGTPLEDRPLGIVVKEPYTPEVRAHPVVVDIRFPGDTGIYSITPNDLELLSGTRN